MKNSKKQIVKIFPYLIFLSLSWPSVFVESTDCQAWFKRQGIKKGADCLIECSIAETDMGTFHCPDQCDRLCRKKQKGQLYLAISKIYPTLTQAEQALVAKYPKKMLIAYQMRWKAENLCLDIFEENGLNDESDACRHFVWSALLYKNLGLEFSQKILSAHENNQEQPVEQKSMDVTNNQLGLTTAEQLKEKNKLEKAVILKTFQKNLKEGKLIILKPGAKTVSSKSFTIKIWNKLKRSKKSKQKEEE